MIDLQINPDGKAFLLSKRYNWEFKDDMNFYYLTPTRKV